MKAEELWLGEEFKPTGTNTIRKTKRGGDSGNPIVFHDYESYIAKFQDKEKTTDDTYTPPDVYDAVVAYVRSIYPMEGKEILRPFYPGGDYERAEYPEDGVVIDNPPFSMFTKICKFYSGGGVPFFLFGPGMTILSCLKYCSAVIVSPQIEFSNGAKVRCNFATNLLGDVLVTTAVKLSKAIAACPSQRQKANLPKYRYPEEVLAVSDFQTMANGDEDFYIRKNEGIIIHDLARLPRRRLFGPHLLVSKATAKAAAVKTAAAKTAAVKAIPIELSLREQLMVERLGQNKQHKDDEERE